MKGKRRSLLLGGRAVVILMSLFCMLAFSSRVSAMPQITGQPSTIAYVNEGEKVAVSITAKGTSLKYQWQVSATGEEGSWKSTKLTGYNTAKLTLAGNAANDAKYYRCAVTDSKKEKQYSNASLLKVYYKPVVTTQPVGKNVSVGTDVTFSIEASSDTALTYQWQRSTNNSTWASISGATNSTYSVNAQSAINGYYYRCLVTNTRGQKVNSKSARLVVHKAIAFTKQPVDTETNEDVKTTLSVSATGETLKYQWQTSMTGAENSWEKTTLSGNTTTKLTVTGIMDNNGRYFRCLVTDKYGESKISNTVRVKVYPKPVINTQPSAKNVNEQTAITFSVGATADTALTYQWQRSKSSSKDWKNVTGATGSSYSMTTQNSDNGYYYRCVVTNTRSQVVNSSPAKLSVHKLLIISTNPVDKSIKEGETAKFTAKATGDGTVQYRWMERKIGESEWSESKASGYKTATLTITGNKNTKDMEYRCRITDSFNLEKYTTSAKLSVNLKPFFSYMPPNTMTVKEGKVFTIHYEVGGDAGPFSYEWRCNGRDLERYTADYKVLATDKMDGSKFCCIATDKLKRKVTSNTVKIHVEKELRLEETLPDYTSFMEGKKFTLSVQAHGDGVKYQWQMLEGGDWKDSTLTGNKTAKLTVPGTREMHNACFRCVVSDQYADQIVSRETRLALKEAPVINTNPEPSIEVFENETVKMSVAASGGGLKYQWKKYSGGSWGNISGATDSTYKFTTKIADNGKKFRCEVTDMFGRKVTSATTVLTVKRVLKFTTQPVGAKVNENVKATMSVVAAGDGVKYQWEESENGQNDSWTATTASGNTTAKLTVTGTEDTKDKYYRCVITDKYGISEASDSVRLTVYLKPRIIVQPKYDGAIAYDGDTVQIKVVAEGDGLTYQWQRNTGSGFKATKETGYNTNKLTVTAYKENRANKYRCKITDSHGQSVISDTTLLQVLDNEVRIETQPVDTVALIGKNVRMTVEAKGAGLSYQWQKKTKNTDWINITDQKVSFLVMPVTEEERDAEVQYRCIVTDRYKKKVTSDSAKVIPIRETEFVDYTKEAIHLDRYKETEIFVKAQGVYELTYLWKEYINDSDCWVAVGPRTDRISVGGAPGRHIYKCFVKDGYGNEVESPEIVVIVHEEITVTKQPESITVTSGETGKLYVEATGTEEYYQWQKKNGDTWDIVYVNNSDGTFEKVMTEKDAGEYRCRIADYANHEAFSDIVTVTVNEPEEPDTPGINEPTAEVILEDVNSYGANVCIKLINFADATGNFVTGRFKSDSDFPVDFDESTFYHEDDCYYFYVNAEDFDETWTFALYWGAPIDKSTWRHVGFYGIEGNGDLVFSVSDLIQDKAEEDTPEGKMINAMLVYNNNVSAYENNTTSTMLSDVLITETGSSKDEYKTIVNPAVEDIFEGVKLFYDNGLKIRLYFNKDLDPANEESEYYCPDLGKLWSYDFDGTYYYFETGDKSGMGIGATEIGEFRSLDLGYEEKDGWTYPRSVIQVNPLSYIYELNEKYANDPSSVDVNELNLLNAAYGYYYYSNKYYESLW